jgi:hypothetical protein
MAARLVPQDEGLTWTEIIFFGTCTLLLTFLLCFGGTHKSSNKSMPVAENQSKKKGFYKNFPASWGGDEGVENTSTQAQGNLPNPASFTDINGFPSFSDISSESGGGAILEHKAAAGSSAWDDFNPSSGHHGSNEDRSLFGLRVRGLGGALTGLKSFGGVIVNSLSFVGGDKEKKDGTVPQFGESVSAEMNSFAPSSEGGDAFKSDEDIFVNVKASNVGKTVNALIDSTEVLKTGRLVTLGARKRDERSPTVKERDLFLAGHYIYYFDMYGARREFHLREAKIGKHTVRATSGQFDGQEFFAIGIEQSSQLLMLGAFSEAYRDEWFDALHGHVELIRKEEVENDGEEEESRRRGLWTASEMRALNPVVVNKVIDTLEVFNVRRRFHAEPESVPMHGTRGSITVKVNAEAVVNPLHPETEPMPDHGQALSDKDKDKDKDKDQ